MSASVSPRDSEYTTTNLLDFTCRECTVKIHKTGCGQEDIHYLEFRGKGPPLPHLGNPGDIYADISSEANQIYGRMMGTWSRWAGPQHSVVHPFQPTLRLWCSGTVFTWKAFTLTFPIQLSTSTRLTFTLTFLNQTSDDQERIPSLTANTLNAGQHISKRKHNEIEVPSSEGSSKKPKLSCQTQTGVHKVLTSASPFPLQRLHKSFKVRSIPADFPHPHAPDGTGSYTISYSQYWSPFLPLADFGSPGDIFVVVSASTHRVLIKKDRWILWEGVNALPLKSQVTHPSFPNMVVWFTEASIAWAHSRKFVLYRSTPKKTVIARHPVIISADDCIRTILQSTPLKPGDVVGSRKIGGSLMYWKTEYERTELQNERLTKENADLKKQITDMQRTVLETSMAGASQLSDVEVLVKMKISLRQNPGLRNLVLIGSSSMAAGC